jgi:hypothetical protein
MTEYGTADANHRDAFVLCNTTSNYAKGRRDDHITPSGDAAHPPGSLAFPQYQLVTCALSHKTEFVSGRTTLQIMTDVREATDSSASSESTTVWDKSENRDPPTKVGVTVPTTATMMGLFLPMNTDHDPAKLSVDQSLTQTVTVSKKTKQHFKSTTYRGEKTNKRTRTH